MSAWVKDYLQTQGLKLSPEAVEMARLASATVMQLADTEIDHRILWYETSEGILAEHLTEDEAHHRWLRQAWLMLDALISRQPVHSAALYYPTAGHWLRLVAQGEPQPMWLVADEADPDLHPAARSALSGWLQHEPGQDVVRSAIPVYGDDGRVLGVLYVEYPPAEAESLGHWIGLALALLPLLQALHAADIPAHTETPS